MVVNHEAGPVMLRGLRRSRGCSLMSGAGSTTVGSRTVAINGLRKSSWWSLQCIQIGDQRCDLGLRQVEVRHHGTRFGLGRIPQPGSQVLVVHLEDGAGEDVATLQVREVGTDRAGGD